MNCPVCGADLPQEALFCGECGSSVTAKPKTRPLVRDPRPSDTTVIEPLERAGRPVATGTPAANKASIAPESSAAPRVTPEAPIAPDAPTAPETPVASVSFTLRFSTGERIVVSGTGLIGRRPIAQPGEQPDQLVSVADTGRSVSKTHLEFGIEAGDLWISDRYSANGTSIIQRSGAARRCEPGRRYRVERGASIEIGDQRIEVG